MLHKQLLSRQRRLIRLTMGPQGLAAALVLVLELELVNLPTRSRSRQRWRKTPPRVSVLHTQGRLWRWSWTFSRAPSTLLVAEPPAVV